MGNSKKLPVLEMTPYVVSALNEELAYQATLPGSDRADAIEHGVAGQLVALKVYADKAMTAWVNSPGDEEALCNLRKVAAIAVRALVHYGCPRRGRPSPTQS